jgi:uncharacterized protein
MANVMPQEIAVWYIIPSLRKEIAKAMIAEGIPRKRVGVVLGLTQAALSQYVSSKRGTNLSFSKGQKELIKKTAKKILSDEKNTLKYLYELTKKFMGAENVCKLHKSKDDCLPVNCKICWK